MRRHQNYCHSVKLSTPVTTNILIEFLLWFNFFLFNIKMDQLKKRTRQPSKKLSTKKKLSSRVMNFLGIQNKTK